MQTSKTTWQGTSKKRRNSAFFLFVLLGMLTAFGPFVTDMYLPSLPAMVDYFSTTASMVQLGLTFSMLGLAVGQIIFGPLSDKYGRKKPLLVSMALFLISTAACIFAPSIKIFVLLRFMQGIAGAGGIVISRSVATDKFKELNLAKALAVIGAINGIAPVVAPVTGGTVLKVTSWQGIFIILFFSGLILTAGCMYFNESLSRMKRSREKLSKTLSLFKHVLSNRKYIFYVLQMAFAQAILFGYIAASPFIIQQHYGFSPFAFSLFFAINSVAIVSGAAIAVKFKRQETGIHTSCIGMLICGALILVALSKGASIILFETLMLILLFMIGITFTIVAALAMNSAKKYSGTASAVLGAAGFLFGNIVSPLVGLGNILVSTGIIFVVCAAFSIFFASLARYYDKIHVK